MSVGGFLRLVLRVFVSFCECCFLFNEFLQVLASVCEFCEFLQVFASSDELSFVLTSFLRGFSEF